MEDIIKEKISADHLLYVSLKYTKTCDVIKNLLRRWKKMIETSIDATLEKAKKKKKIPSIPTNPVKKIEAMKKIFKKDSTTQEVMDFYDMLRKLEDLKTRKVGEFRKNVCLVIMYRGKEIHVNLEKLKEYSQMLEKFISNTKQFLLK